MNDNKLTAKEAANHSSDMPCRHTAQIKTFLIEASSQQIQEYLHNLVPLDDKNLWFHLAKVALDIRLSQDAAKTAEKMAEQNAILVNESRALTKYTRGLYLLTVALVGFAIVQIVIMIIDYQKHA